MTGTARAVAPGQGQEPPNGVSYEGDPVGASGGGRREGFVLHGWQEDAYGRDAGPPESGRLEGAHATSSFTPPQAKPTPSRPPMTASTVLSTII